MNYIISYSFVIEIYFDYKVFDLDIAPIQKLGCIEGLSIQ